MRHSLRSVAVTAALAWLPIALDGPIAMSRTHAAEVASNLARQARATGRESQEDLTPEKANDGKKETRWSGIPGHDAGVWYQLDWDRPVEIGEVIVHQFDTYVFELDVQLRAESAADWKTVQHVGRVGKRLPKIVASRFEPRKVTGLRIVSIKGGPSFTEVEVYGRPFTSGIATHLASDLRGNLVGIVTDRSGATPCEGAEVTLSGESKGGRWNRTARSDDKGMFLVPMPLGIQGPIRVRTRLKTSQAEPIAAESQVDAAAFAYGLTPREARHEMTNLSGKWKFMADPPEGFWQTDFDDTNWAEIAVPAHWEMEGFHSDAGIGGYRLRFAAPQGKGRPKLCFEGVYSGAEVWVNGQLVATHEGGATPFEVDIADVVRKGANLLALRVKEHTTTSDELDHMSHYAYFPLAGIMRPVYLFCVPEVHVGGLEITTTFDKDYRDATMAVRARVLNESSEAFRGELALSLAGPLPGQEELAKAKPAVVEMGPWHSTDVEVSIPVTAPKKWDAEHPNLYPLSVELSSDGRVAHRFALRTGFRQTQIRGSEILINGKPVKLRGTCHHDSHPLMGRAVNAELTRQDLELMKEANLNAVRTSHYPPLADLLHIADELGLYVEDEASFCWVGISDDLRQTPRIIQLTAELLARDRNHPSVAFWSLCNESRFGYGFERSHEWVRRADPSRPTSAAISTWLEIATLHNPLAISRIDEHENLQQPLIFDESLCIYQGIFGDVAEMWVDPGMRDYYAQPQPPIYERFMRSKTTQGSFIWCWSDDVFCVPGRGYEYGRGTARSHFLENSYRVPGRGLVGDAPWGVVDGWRRPKPEFWITKKLHSPVKVKEEPLRLPGPNEPIRVAVENQYDFSNLSEMTILWAIGGEKGELRCDVPPRSAGTVEIRPRRMVNEGEILTLRFEDNQGTLVDAYRLPLGREATHRPPCERCTPQPLRIWEEDTLAGTCTTIAGKDFQLAFDQRSGLLRRGVGNGQPLLLEMPTLHVLPTTRPLQPLPDRLSWKLEKLDVRREGANVCVTIKGRYEDFQGQYELTITPSGELAVDSSFEYTGEEFLAREIGLRFSVPKECDVLEWDRAAEWSVYPPDHIGRPRGTAPAFPEDASTVPPTGPWSKDVSPMGSNDFRSTKRNVRWAGIHCPNGPGILIEASGHQHVRAMVETDRISVHVNDFFGGTNVGWWEWIHNYGKGQAIRNGERIASRVRLSVTPALARVPLALPVLWPWLTFHGVALRSRQWHTASQSNSPSQIVEHAYDFGNRWVRKVLDPDGAATGENLESAVFVYDGPA
ncbi:MAG: hypothetical protein A2V70_15360, partial [Planctomycetes bacterium RBG_13_63_9]